MNTWMKWSMFREDGRFPFYIFVIGDTHDPEHTAVPIVCTVEDGTVFYVTQRFVDRLTEVSLEEAVRLNIFKATIVAPGEPFDDDEPPEASAAVEPEPLFFIATDCP